LQGPQAVALPQNIHQAFSGSLHQGVPYPYWTTVPSGVSGGTKNGEG
jgi:hypothetical protein